MSWLDFKMHIAPHDRPIEKPNPLAQLVEQRDKRTLDSMEKQAYPEDKDLIDLLQQEQEN